MERMVGQKYIDALILVIPFLNDFTTQDMMFSVCDREKYLEFAPAKTFKVNLKPGDPVKPGSASGTAMREKRMVEVTVPREVLGIPYKAIAAPIYDEKGEVIGALSVGTSLENQERLTNTLKQFSEAFQQINNSVQEISTGAQHLAKSGQGLAELTFEAKKSVKETDEILSAIRHIADQSKMLGLNAAIEAARAGELGRGFAVVAEEIRRLSENSSSSTKQVAAILTKISANIDKINSEAQETNAVSQEQAAATQEIAASVQELFAMLEEIKSFAKLL